MNLRRVAAAAIDPREFVDGANRAFGHWGDASTFAWAFRGDAELLFLDEGDRALAGSGILWRMLPCDQRAAIIVGSWTLPEARGRGAFTRILNATYDIARERNALLLGFGRANNDSRRRFDALGASMVPTFYCRSTAAKPSDEPIEPADPDPSFFRSGFVYTPSEWREQFLERPGTIECVGVRDSWRAIVERSGDFDRVHAVSDTAALPALAARAHGAGRRLFWFATERPSFASEWTDGFLYVLPASTITTSAFQNGDRM